jgi:ABC-2 type transport system permease protein
MGGELARGAGLIGAFVRANLRKVLEYRTNFAIGVAAIMTRHVIGLLTLWVIFAHTRALGRWEPYQVLYLYGYMSLIVAIWHATLANTLRVEVLVRDAGFDLFLVRPLPPLFQLMFYYFDDDALGDFIPAIACLAVASARLDVRYTPATMLVFALGLAGGVLIHFGIHLLLSAWSFWYVKSRALLNLFSELRRFGDYPLDIFPVTIQWLLTVVVPIAFAGFFPAAEVLSPESFVWIAWLSLPVGVLAVAVGGVVWHRGLATYQSAGS